MAGRSKKKCEAKADPNFFGVQQDGSLRAEVSRKGTRRSSNASAGDPKRPATSVWPLGARQSDLGQWRLVATPAAISLWVSPRPVHRPASPAVHDPEIAKRYRLLWQARPSGSIVAAQRLGGPSHA